jgi:hypothetical protein
MKTFESKESLMEAISVMLTDKAYVKVILCPENGYKPDGKTAIKKCFSLSTEVGEFVEVVNFGLGPFSTKILGWQTDYNVTIADFVTNDQKYMIGFAYVPKVGSARENYAPLKNDTVFLSVIVEDNKTK